MCNVEEDGDRGPVQRVINSVVGRKCMKCDQPGILIIRTHDSFCRDCFMVYVIHKFRSIIGKSRLIRDGEHVLVAFSGGANSAALIHLISDGLSERAHKKLRFRPTLVYVDECSLLDMSDSERRQVQQCVADIMTSSGFPAYMSSLEQALQKDLSCVNQEADFYWEAVADPTRLRIPEPGDQQRLKKLVSSFKSTTCKEDFVRNLRKQLLVAVAKSLGLNKVMTGDCSTRLAVQTLTDMAQGRGSQAALNTAFSDARYDDIMVVRPLRDLNTKELALYNRLCGVDSVTIPSLTTKAPTGASIERLTEGFVTGLQSDYPATVSNIVRTSQKLLQPDTQDVDKCSFCQSPLDTKVGASSALNAIRFSRKLSQFSHLQKQQHNATSLKSPESQKEGMAVNKDLPALSTCDEDKNFHASLDDSSAEDVIMSTLCFGCQLSLRDFGDDLQSLPTFVSSRAQLNNYTNRERIKEGLSSFLLEDTAS